MAGVINGAHGGVSSRGSVYGPGHAGRVSGDGGHERNRLTCAYVRGRGRDRDGNSLRRWGRLLSGGGAAAAASGEEYERTQDREN